MSTTATHVGEVVTATIIRLGTVQSVCDGYVQQCPTLHYAIALRADDLETWEPIYEVGGDWDGIDADSLDDVLTLGAMDDSHETDSQRLTDAAEILARWALEAEQIDPRNDALVTASEYLKERARASLAQAS